LGCYGLNLSGSCIYEITVTSASFIGEEVEVNHKKSAANEFRINFVILTLNEKNYASLPHRYAELQPIKPALILNKE